MGAPLPKISRERFARRLETAVSSPVEGSAVDALFAHYEELRRWNRRLSLIGPGTADEAVETHYAEALEGRELLEPGDRTLVDLGSGAGFPGLVLAAAVPALEVWLVEPQSRKWAFLRAAAAAASVECHCLDARVEKELPFGLPDRIDVLTVRALKLETAAWTPLAARLGSGGRLLRWGSAERPDELAAWTAGRRHRLRGRDRWIVEWRPAG